MGQSLAIPRVIPEDWQRLDLIVSKIKMRLGRDSNPVHAGITLTGLTAERLVWSDANKALASKDLIDLVAGTANEISISDDGSGGVTIGIVDPLIVGKGGIGTNTLTDHGILLGSGTGAVTPLGVASNGQLPIGSVGADPVLATLTGTAKRVIVTNGAGTITLSGPQDLDAVDSPTFAGLTITGSSVHGLNSAVFQPTTDSTTFFQVNDKDGNVIGNFDTVNNRFGIRTATPDTILDVETSTTADGIIAGNLFVGVWNNSVNYATMCHKNFRITDSATKYAFIQEANGQTFFNGNPNLFFQLSGNGAMVLYASNGLALGVNFRAIDPGINSMIIQGSLGVGESAPETLTELTGATPYLTLHNSTHEDSDGGRESRLNFKGEQSGGEETTLARIQVSHAGSADDEKGQLQFYTNPTAGGNSPTLAMTISELQKVGIGMAVPSRKLTVVENDSDAIFIRHTDGTDASTLGFGINTSSGYAFIQSRNDAAGTIQPLTFWIGDTEKLRISTTGVFTLTPDANTDTVVNFIGTTNSGVLTWMEDEDYFKFDDDIRLDGFLQLTQKAGTATDGDLWNDSTQEALQTFVNGIEQTLVGTIFTQTADKTIADTTTETTLFGTGIGTLTLPANFWVVGKTIRIEIHGDFADTGNPTAEIQAYYGATSLIDSGAITLSGLAGTEEWECEVVITCRSIGASGTVQTVIDWEYETTVGSSAIERLDVEGVLRTIDTTASGALDVTFQWGTAAAANTIHSHVAFVTVLN